MYLCLYVSVYVCMQICICTYEYNCMYVCMYVCICKYTCICMYICMHIHRCMYVCMYVCMYASMNVLYVYMFDLCMFICIQAEESDWNYIIIYYFFKLILYTVKKHSGTFLSKKRNRLVSYQIWSLYSSAYLHQFQLFLTHRLYIHYN